MSCCTNTKKCSSQKELEGLRKHFDAVTIEDLDKYKLLTLKDKSKKSSMDWIVWIQVKVAYGYSEGHTSKTDDEQLSKVCESINEWIELLKNFDKNSQVKQISLFDDDTNGIELKPESPKNDKGWSSYFKVCEAIDKRNTIKKFKFFDMCDLMYPKYIYKDVDYRHLLPESSEELIEIIKDVIVQTETNRIDENKDENSWEYSSFDNEYNYIAYGKALSDIELMNRLKFMLRIYLVPYKRYYHKGNHNDNEPIVYGTRHSSRFWYNLGKIESNQYTDMDKQIMPEYTIFTDEFVQWLRDYFDIPISEYISDEDILKENMKCFFKSIFGHELEGFTTTIESSNKWQEFRKKVYAHPDYSNNCGGSGYSLDGFKGSYSLFGKGEVSVRQSQADRNRMGRNVDDLKPYFLDSENTLLWSFKGDEIYKKTFELFKNEGVKQSSIFDFMAA